MLSKFLCDVVGIVVGKNAEEISNLLLSKKYVNEFILAKKMDLTINQTRNILYRLANKGLVLSIRKKDKKKGWYTYFWKFDILKNLEFLKNIDLKRSEQFKNQIKNRESRVFYFCERCNIELNETNALLYDFTCNECGDVFKIKDNTELLKKFKKNLNNLEKEISEINIEIEKEKVKIEKEKDKELKLIAKKKELQKDLKKKSKIKLSKEEIPDKKLKKGSKDKKSKIKLSKEEIPGKKLKKISEKKKIKEK